MSDSTATAGATAGVTAGGTATPFKVFATEDDFNAHAASIRAQAERKAKGVTADERASLEALQTELETRKARDLEAAGNYEKAKTTLQAAADAKIAKATAELDKAKGIAHKALVVESLKSLAIAHGAYDPEDIIARLGARATLNEDYEVVVLGEDGKPKDGLMLEAAVVDLLKAKPHLAKASAGKGAGSAGGASLASQSASGSPAQRELAAQLEAAQKAVAANPRDNDLVGRVLTIQGQIRAGASA